MTLRSMGMTILGVSLMGAPAFAAQPARPGTVNYVEGAAYIDGQALDAKQIGNINLDAGEELSTAQGKAEILLTPGVFLRVDSHSTVKMISPELTLTQVELEKGRVSVEVDEIHDENNLQVLDAGLSTRFQKNGYYEFDANHPEVMVFKGKAAVEVADGASREVKGGHDFVLAASAEGRPIAKEKPATFNKEESQDELFNWSKLRSQYLAEANNQVAGEYGGAGYYPGWYWDPWGYGYTFIGASPFYSPFGWGFYPFGWGGWYGGGWYGGRAYYRGGYSHPAVAGGFHGGVGGGFHGGGGRR